MPHRLLRPADKTKTALFSRLSDYHSKTLFQQQSQSQPTLQQSVQCNLNSLSQQTRGYISEIRKWAFKGNILRLLRNKIQYELVRSPSPQLRPALTHNRPFCTNNKPANPINNSIDKAKVEEGPLTHYDSYRDLDKLDFMTAAKILFTTPPKKKKFGLDFHLVQLFFVCLPSLAVYLVAQYARSEMRRMDAELEVRKQAKEAKAKEMEQKAAEERARSDPQILEVKVRLEKLEETVKEFVIESKKQSATSKNQEANIKQPARTSPGNNGKRSEPNNSSVKDHQVEQTSKERVKGSGPEEPNQSAVATDASPEDQNATQGGNPSRV